MMLSLLSVRIYKKKTKRILKVSNVKSLEIIINIEIMNFLFYFIIKSKYLIENLKNKNN